MVGENERRVNTLAHSLHQHQLSFTAVTRSNTASFALPKNINELSAAKSGFGIPAKPGLRLRLITTTVRDLSTSRIGMPAIGPELSSRASGLTTSLAPMTNATSVCWNVALMRSISTSFS